MSFELINTASTTAMLANVATVFGENIDGILIIVGGIAGVYLAFWGGRALLSYFSSRGRSAR